MDKELTELEKIAVGQAVARAFGLKKASGFNPPRWHTAWGTKTALGVFAVVERLHDEKGV